MQDVAQTLGCFPDAGTLSNEHIPNEKIDHIWVFNQVRHFRHDYGCQKIIVESAILVRRFHNQFGLLLQVRDQLISTPFEREVH